LYKHVTITEPKSDVRFASANMSVHPTSVSLCFTPAGDFIVNRKKYIGERKMKVSIIIEKDQYGYYSFCPQLKGCHTQGDSLEEVLENIKEAIELFRNFIAT